MKTTITNAIAIAKELSPFDTNSIAVNVVDDYKVILDNHDYVVAMVNRAEICGVEFPNQIYTDHYHYGDGDAIFAIIAHEAKARGEYRYRPTYQLSVGTRIPMVANSGYPVLATIVQRMGYKAIAVPGDGDYPLRNAWLYIAPKR